MSRGSSAAAAARSRRSGLAEHRRQVFALSRWIAAGLWRGVRTAIGFVAAFAALGLLAFGLFRDIGTNAVHNARAEGTPQLLALAGLCVLVVARLFERVGRSGRARGESSAWLEAEVGTLFVAVAFVVIEITGGPSGLLYPLIYALVAFLVAFHPPSLSVYFVVLILATETAINALQPTPGGWRLCASHASFNILFASLYALFLRTEVATRRHAVKHEITSHLSSIAQQARDFRLTSALSLDSRDLSRAEAEHRRLVGSVEAIRDADLNLLTLAEHALRPHTVALYWLDTDERFLRLRELRSQSDRLSEAPVAAGEGFLGAVAKSKKPLVLTHLRPAHPGLTYYRGGETVTDFVAVPVLEGAHLRGVLLADRKDGVPFDDADVATAKTVAAEAVRSIQVEQLLAQMDREKYQRERFYQASREFNSARTVEQVAQVAISAARRVTEAELAAVAVATDEEGMLRIAAAEWNGREDKAAAMPGRVFAADAGLVGAALKARAPLPHGAGRALTQSVFDKSLSLPLKSVKVFPLLWKSLGVGALVVGDSRADLLGSDRLEMMRVIADHGAIAIANAQMYERMERMATTDGLTGLVNHRHFQTLFDASVARVQRYERKLALILVDIDHFKSINDTYGHPVGDRVLARIASILRGTARCTDVVARHGGEEFAVLMEETDPKGAYQMAERLRRAVESALFRCDEGPFRCTISSGLATFPRDGASKARLTECADRALYDAKRNGRNRTVAFASGDEAQAAG